MDRRSIGWAVIVLGTLGALFATPAFADPAPPPGGVPDPGVPPVATAPLVPGGSVPISTQTGTPVVGPLAAQILTLRAEVEGIGEQLTKLSIDVDAAKQATATTRRAWAQAKEQADRLREHADDAAAKAYKQATALGPWGDYANDLNQLDELVPGGLAIDPDHDPGGAQSAAMDAATAADLEHRAHEAYDAAVAAENRLTTQQAALRATHTQKSAALADLTTQNTQAVQEADAAQIARDAALAGQFAPGSDAAGLAPNPIALAAARAAYSKLGKPYVWGTQGPNTFDCSGLVLWAYRQAGYTGLPRVAADQYHATKPVPTSQLVVGDLLFFSTTSRSDWTTISHVGIYYGGDFMIEAPNSGDVVKVAHIWWSAFFGATRVVNAVPAPAPGPTKASPSPTKPSSPASSSASSSASASASSSAPSSAPPSTSSAAPTSATSSSASPTPPAPAPAPAPVSQSSSPGPAP